MFIFLGFSSHWPFRRDDTGFSINGKIQTTWTRRSPLPNLDIVQFFCIRLLWWSLPTVFLSDRSLIGEMKWAIMWLKVAFKANLLLISSFDNFNRIERYNVVGQRNASFSSCVRNFEDKKGRKTWRMIKDFYSRVKKSFAAAAARYWWKSEVYVLTIGWPVKQFIAGPFYV